MNQYGCVGKSPSELGCASSIFNLILLFEGNIICYTCGFVAENKSYSI